MDGEQVHCIDGTRYRYRNTLQVTWSVHIPIQVHRRSTRSPGQLMCRVVFEMHIVLEVKERGAQERYLISNQMELALLTNSMGFRSLLSVNRTAVLRATLTEGNRGSYVIGEQPVVIVCSKFFWTKLT